MSKAVRAGLAALLFAGASSFAIAQDAAAPAVPAMPEISVNGEQVTATDLMIAMEDVGPTLPERMGGQQRELYIIDYAIDLRLAAAAAEKAGIVDQAALEQRMAYFRKKVLMEQLLQKTAREAATDDAMKKVYDEEVGKLTPEEEVRASHILVPTEEEAKKVIERLGKGEDFAAVAKSESKDPGGADGGDLGWFTADRMVPEFSQAAFALKPGELSAPVKSQFGWHVIRLTERRKKEPPPFEAVKTQIAQYLGQKAQRDLIVKLREEAKIVKPQPPAAPAQPAPAAPAEAPKQ